MIGTANASRAISTEAVLDTIRKAVFRGRIRLHEFFADFDPLRSGLISEAKFRTALDASGLRLNDPEMANLTAYYAEDPSIEQKRIRYKDLLADVDVVFNTSGMETNPYATSTDFTPQVAPPPSPFAPAPPCPGPFFSARLSPGAQSQRGANAEPRPLATRSSRSSSRRSPRRRRRRAPTCSSSSRTSSRSASSSSGPSTTTTSATSTRPSRCAPYPAQRAVARAVAPPAHGRRSRPSHPAPERATRGVSSWYALAGGGGPLAAGGTARHPWRRRLAAAGRL